MSDKPVRPLEPSEVAKNEAEALKIAAETQKALAEARKYDAEADQARHLADQEALKQQTAQYVADREAEKRSRELAKFDRDFIYNFDGAVNSKSVTDCINELRYWHKLDSGCDITIVFDSPGGSVFDGMNLYDYIQELKDSGHSVTTATRGMAASMGGILLQAGNRRVMGAEAWILIHEISTITGGKIGEIEDEVELVKKIQERVLGIFASKSKLTKTTLRRKWRRRDWWIDSTEALKSGLVDEVAPVL